MLNLEEHKNDLSDNSLDCSRMNSLLISGDIDDLFAQVRTENTQALKRLESTNLDKPEYQNLFEPSESTIALTDFEKLESQFEKMHEKHLIDR